MTSKGTAHGRFQRAIQRRHLFHAEVAARELGQLSLTDALALCLLIAEQEPARWPRAAARWHARFVLEARGIGLEGSAQALLCVAGLTGVADRASAQTLRELARRHGVPA